MLEEAWAMVQASSCSQGCALLNTCDRPRRVARGEDGFWRVRVLDGHPVLVCTDRQATHYWKAITDDKRHVVGWERHPVPDWRERRKTELAKQEARDAKELARRQRQHAYATPLPKPEVSARPATEAELDACSPAQTLVEQARGRGHHVEAFYARGFTRHIGSKDEDVGGLGDAHRKAKPGQAKPATFDAIESILVRGRVGAHTFARYWDRRVGAEKWATGGRSRIDRTLCSAADVNRLINGQG